MSAPRRYRLEGAEGHGDLLIELDRPVATAFSLDSDGSLGLADGARIEPRTFERQRPDGTRIKDYGHPASYALDDYLYVWDLYYVKDGALHAAMAAFGRRFECRLENDRIELAGLTLLASG